MGVGKRWALRWLTKTITRIFRQTRVNDGRTRLKIAGVEDQTEME